MIKKQKGGDNLVQRTVMTYEDVWIDVKVKAAKEKISVSKVVTSLLRQWLSGEVKVKENDN